MLPKKQTLRTITQKQIDYILILGNQLDLNRQDVLERATKTCGRFIADLGELNIQEASTLIDYLKELKSYEKF